MVQASMPMNAKGYEDCYFNSSDGLRLYFRDYSTETGQGRAPVLCLPGLTRNSRDFEPLAGLLARDRRIISPDLRGRGLSERDSNWRNYNPDQYIADIEMLLQRLDIPEVVIVGTSLGGWLAMLMSTKRPDVLIGAVLNDIGPEANAGGLARVVNATGTLERVAEFSDAVRQTRSNYEIAYPDWTEEEWRWFTHSTYRECADGQFDLNYDRNIGRAAREGVSGLQQNPWQTFDGLLDKPALLLHGVLSDILTNDIIVKMRERKPDLRVATVPNRGHAPLLNEQEAIDAITGFVGEL